MKFHIPLFMRLEFKRLFPQASAVSKQLEEGEVVRAIRLLELDAFKHSRLSSAEVSRKIDLVLSKIEIDNDVKITNYDSRLLTRLVKYDPNARNLAEVLYLEINKKERDLNWWSSGPTVGSLLKHLIDDYDSKQSGWQAQVLLGKLLRHLVQNCDHQLQLEVGISVEIIEFFETLDIIKTLDVLKEKTNGKNLQEAQALIDKAWRIFGEEKITNGKKTVGTIIEMIVTE